MHGCPKRNASWRVVLGNDTHGIENRYRVGSVGVPLIAKMARREEASRVREI